MVTEGSAETPPGACSPCRHLSPQPRPAEVQPAAAPPQLLPEIKSAQLRRLPWLWVVASLPS